MKRKIICFAALVSVLLILLSCGYRFSPGGEQISPAIQNIYVDNFGNNTSEANAENQFRSAFIDRFRSTSRFKLIESYAQADAVLKGTIVNLVSSHLSYTSTNVAREDRVVVVLNLIFETRNKEIIWANNAFSWYADYLVDPNNPTVTENNRRVAIQNLARDTSDKAYRAIMSGF